MSDIITVTFSREDANWLDAVADDLALDASGVIRMLVRQARKNGQTVNTNGHDPYNGQTAQADAEQAARRAEEAKRRAQIEARKAALRAELAAIGDDLTAYTTDRSGQRAAEDAGLFEDFEVPPDPDDGVASDELRDLLARQPASSTVRAPPRGPPGTLVEPVGVNRAVGSGYTHGDAVGNLTRQNFGHLGFTAGSRG